MSDLTPDSRDLIHDRQALDDLQLTYQAFLTVLHEPEMLFAILDAQGRTLMANETLARSLHRSPEQMTGRLIFDLMPVEEAKFRRDVFEQVVRAGEALRVDDLTDSGKIFDSSVFPIFDAQGKLAKVVVLARDVTAHRQMEAALRASEARYRALTEIAPAAIVMTDLGGKLLLANPSFARLMGYSNAEAALGEIGIVQRIFSAHDQPALERLLARLLAGGQVGPADLEVQRKDGEPRTVAAHGAVLPGETGATLGMIIYLQDVTATRHEHRELLLARRELEQRVQARTAELEQMNESLHNEILAHYETDTALRQAAARANALARVAERINAELDLTATLQAICDETGTTLGYEHGAILLYREDQDALAAAAASGAHHLPVELIPPVPRRLYESYLERLGRVIIIPDWRSLRERFPDFVNRLDIRTVVSVPFYHDGDLPGAM
ncbi:MAG: PAS domain S-box protein, partial [Chloroflexota bacterium]